MPVKAFVFPRPACHFKWLTTGTLPLPSALLVYNFTPRLTGDSIASYPKRITRAEARAGAAFKKLARFSACCFPGENHRFTSRRYPLPVESAPHTCLKPLKKLQLACRKNVEEPQSYPFLHSRAKHRLQADHWIDSPRREGGFPLSTVSVTRSFRLGR